MTAREAILDAVRRNLPRPAADLPPLQEAGAQTIGSSLPYFRRQVEAMGGRTFDVSDAADVPAKIAELFSAAASSALRWRR